MSGNREKVVEHRYNVRDRRDWNMILVNAAYTQKRKRERSMAIWMHHHIQVWLEVRDWWHRHHLVINCSHLLLYVWLPACLWTNCMPNDMLPHSRFLFSHSRDVLLSYLTTYITTYFLCEHVQTNNASDGWANILSYRPVKAHFSLLVPWKG